MNDSASPQKKPFHFSWNDKESRSIIIQTITIVAILLFFGYIIRNAVINLEAVGRNFSYSFLGSTASYDINQHLIEYTSRSTHLRATIVGILNTLLVAFCGIILATIIGFFLGVMRLSKNWLASKLAYCYIEWFRNVPVLLHILLIHGIIVHSLPVPKQAIDIGGVAFLTNRGFFSPQPLAEPLLWLVIGLFAVGIIFSIWFKSYAKKIQDETGKHYPVFLIQIGAVVGVPLLAYFLLGSPIEWMLPELKGFNFRGGMVIRPEFIALWLALSLYTASFIGEIVRAGIVAVSYGQTEASYSLGIKPSRTLNLIVIPQALRVIVPPLNSQYLNLTKNSSLAIAIGYMDVTATIGGISLNQTGREMESMLIVLTFYFVLSMIISALMNWYNNHIKLIER